MTFARAVLAILSAVPLLASTQTPFGSHAQLLLDTGKRIADLYRTFDDLLTTPSEQAFAQACSTNCPAASSELARAAQSAEVQRLAQQDRVMSQIHAEVDQYVARAFDPQHVTRQSVQQDLRRILPSDYGQAPTAFILPSTAGRSLIVIYAVSKGQLMGPHATSVVLRAYHPSHPRFALANVAGADLAGFAGVSATLLPSPLPNQLYLLVSGFMTGANGPNNRMRIYAYDGTRFRPIWMPEDAWGTFQVATTLHGFLIRGDYYREDRPRHDAYVLEEDAVARLPPH